MATVIVSTEIPASADDVWQRVGAFGAVADWNPDVALCDADGDVAGAVRTVELSDGRGVAHERLEILDADHHSYTWAMLDGPLPVAHYMGQLRVSEVDDTHSTVVWTCEFQPTRGHEVVDTLRTRYRAALERMRSLFER